MVNLSSAIKSFLARNEKIIEANRSHFPVFDLHPRSTEKQYDTYKKRMNSLRTKRAKEQKEKLFEQAKQLEIRTVGKSQTQLKTQIEHKIKVEAEKAEQRKVPILYEGVVSSAIKGFSQAQRVDGLDQKDLSVYFSMVHNTYKHILIRRLKELKGLRFQLSVQIMMKKTKVSLLRKKSIKENVEAPFYFYSLPYTINNPHEISQIMGEANAKIKRRLDKFVMNGSGWTVSHIIQSYVNTVIYKPMRGSNFLPLPKHIQVKNAIINVKNDDNECFKWAVLSALHHEDVDQKSASRVTVYRKWKDDLKFDGIEFPVTAKDYPKFEEMNDITINVLYLDDKSVIPLYTTKSKREKHVNLFLHQMEMGEGGEIAGHYSWIKNMSRLLANQYTKHDGKMSYCDYCLQGFHDTDKYNTHISEALCRNFSQVKTTLPQEEAAFMDFKSYRNLLPTPYFIVADFESLLEEVLDSTGVQTIKSHQHVPCAYGYKVVCTFDSKKSQEYVSYRGEDTPKHFLTSILKTTEKLKKSLTKHCEKNNVSTLIMTEEEDDLYNHSNRCWICQRGFDEDSDDKKVRDHCHLSNQFRGAAHSTCNLKLNYSAWKVPVILHNFKGYDSHFIIQALDKGIKNISCIPQSTEKFTTLSFCDVRFIDSLNFLQASLDTLSSNIPSEGFSILKSEFKGLSDEKLNLIKTKGVYPYEYMNDKSRFLEKSLPSQKEFYSSLKREGVSDEEYAHAQKVWKEFAIKDLGDYTDLYLKTDVMLLAVVWDNFRKLCIRTSRLEPSWYVSLPSFSFDKLFISKQTEFIVKDNEKFQWHIDLFKDGQDDMYQWVEKSIRGGISTITHRHAEANNDQMDSYNKNLPSSTIKYLDANNLYGWAMSQKLPTGEYKWERNPDEWTTEKILQLSDDASYGYIFEVDLKYPKELHDLHNDYPLAPESLSVSDEMLSDYSRSFLQKYETEQLGTNKLIPNLNDKKNYTLHYRNLKLYLKLGLVLEKVHKVLSFAQDSWMKDYVDSHTTMRAAAKNDFEKDFYKLSVNAVFGKTMENVRNRIKYDLVSSSEESKLKKLVAKPTYKSCRNINEEIVGIERSVNEVKLDKPIAVGFSILELSKVLMYDFHYNVVKKVFGERSKLLFTDTDSLCYSLQTENFYKEMEEYQNLFDCSELSKDHQWFSTTNKKVIGKFKDETKGIEIKEFVGLRSKMYSYILSNEVEIKKAKGTAKSVVKRDLSHSNYKDCITENKLQNVSMTTFRSDNHTIYTNVIKKIGLSAFDDKRYILENGIATLAHGHYRIPILVI